MKTVGAFLCLLLVGCGPREELDVAEQRLLSVSRKIPARCEIPPNARLAGSSPSLCCRKEREQLNGAGEVLYVQSHIRHL